MSAALKSSRFFLLSLLSVEYFMSQVARLPKKVLLSTAFVFAWYWLEYAFTYGLIYACVIWDRQKKCNATSMIRPSRLSLLRYRWVISGQGQPNTTIDLHHTTVAPNPKETYVIFLPHIYALYPLICRLLSQNVSYKITHIHCMHFNGCKARSANIFSFYIYVLDFL